MKQQSKSIVYQIMCDCVAVYNGGTKVGLANRMKRHGTGIKEDDKDSSSEMVMYVRSE